MKLHRTLRRTAAAATVALAGSVGVIAASAPAGAGVLPGSYTVSVTPSTSEASVRSTYVVTFTNNSLPDSVDLLNSASITLAAGFSNVSAPSSTSDSLGAPWTVAVSGNTVSVSSLIGVLPGGSVSVPVTATAPPASGTYQWSSTAGGLVNGATATGPFTIVGGDPAISVNAGSPTKLVFIQQPTLVQVGNAITPAIKVAVQDASGNTVPYSSPVTLSAAFNPNTGNATNPSGLPVSATPSNGVATFSNVKINTVGIGYRLRAASGSLTPATSDSFDVATKVGTCPANTQCDTGTIGDARNTEARMIVESGSAKDLYRLTVGGYPNYTCTGSSASDGQPVTFENVDESRVLKIIMTLDKTKVQTSVNNGSAHYGACFESKSPFMTKQGTTSPLGPNGFYRGFLPLCSITANAPPCLVGVTGSAGGDRQMTLRSTPGDPRSMFGILPGSES